MNLGFAYPSDHRHLSRIAPPSLIQMYEGQWPRAC
ncbi:hypothetical protein SBRY_11164 [Actinacidiphila bryophytorum]|uniref:Uncharacterized protein n=1 Tax=Actinacidiphila bryophytorum TaxID=1436133 RepID=A0A9W4E0F1_9ACTN|nr:hypothetical protein SBRY_11164 [Actinacidiphila bryophytorum]